MTSTSAVCVTMLHLISAIVFLPLASGFLHSPYKFSILDLITPSSYRHPGIKDAVSHKKTIYDLFKRGSRQFADRMTSPEDCPSDYEIGTNGCCIPPWGYCDSYYDCADGYDENTEVCLSRNCADGYVQCRSGTHAGSCILTSRLCDGHDDCGGGYDEDVNVCLSTPCDPGDEKCSKGRHLGRCISRLSMCDGHSQCARDSADRGWDEKARVCLRLPCSQDTQFMCPRGSGQAGRCVPRYRLCDGYDDCGGGADEVVDNCRATPCGDNHKPCRDGRCYFADFECDGEEDCADGSDEVPSVCGHK